MSCLDYYLYSLSCLAMTQIFRPSREEGAPPLLLQQQSDMLRLVPHLVLTHISIVLHVCKRPV